MNPRLPRRLRTGAGAPGHDEKEMTSPKPPNVYRDFWTCAYQAIDD
jgi:hypothetical protein